MTLRRSRSHGRRAAREAALQMLYQWEVGQAPIDQAAASYAALDDDPLPEASLAFAASLAQHVVTHVAAIDPLIDQAAEHWRLSRMAVVDRLILRMGTFELMSGAETPAVAINEAVELARVFSGDEAVKFVNGVLDAVHRGLAAARKE